MFKKLSNIFRSDNTEISSDEYLKHNANKVNQVMKENLLMKMA